MAATVRLQLDRQAMGDVALRSEGVQALISRMTEAGASAAASSSGEDTGPNVFLGRERWYGTYGVSAKAEAENSAASSSTGAMR